MISTWPLTQFWLPQQEGGFRPGTAAFSWSAGKLHLLASLVDERVSTTATAHQQRLWEHGDVIELFFRRQGDNDYFEYQIAPNGFTLALHYPDKLSVMAMRGGERPLDDFFTALPLEAEAVITEEGWNAKLTVPLKGNPGDIIYASCSRYDDGTGRPPVLSSTSPHPVRDFHRMEDWRKMILG